MSDLIELYAAHGYWVLGLVILLENAGLPLPGETALLAAGYLTSADGGSRFQLWAVVSVAFVAAVVGDNVGYWLGRQFARRRLIAGRRFLLLTPERMVLAESYFARYGAVTVFFARFVALLRMIAGPAAGAAGMPWGRFLPANAAGAFVWAASVAVLGHIFGHAWVALRRWLGWGAWAAVAVVILILAGYWAVSRIRRAGPTQSSPPIAERAPTP